MLDAYDRLSDRAAYRYDLIEAARQALADLGRTYVDRIRKAYAAGDVEGVSHWGAEFLSLFDIQSAVVSHRADMRLGTWLENTRRHGRTAAEKTYFEWNARVQITLCGSREGAAKLRDYAAREWQGLLEDFYRPRWESFLSRLELSLLTGRELEKIRHYDEELPFVYRKNSYPTACAYTGDLREAVGAALNKVRAANLTGHSDASQRTSFEENVKNDLN